MAHEFNSNPGGAVRPEPASAGVESAPETAPGRRLKPAPVQKRRAEQGPIATDYADYRLVPGRDPWRWVGTAVVALGVAGMPGPLATNPRWEWGVVAQWFTAQSIVNGLLETAPS